MKNIFRSKKQLAWIIAVVIVVVLISLVIMRIKHVQNIASQKITPWALNTDVAREASVTAGYPVLATLITQGNVTLTAQIGGTLVSMGPREGVTVRKGSFLAQIDTRTIQDNLAGLKARLTAAQADMKRKNDEYVREQNLFNNGGSSQSSLDAYHTASIAATNEVTSIENQIKALSVNEEYGRIIAPVNGIISARFHEPGDVIMPGQPIYQITTTSGARIHVEFPQDILRQLKVGADLQLFHNGDTLIVKLHRIFPLLNGFDLGAAEADLSQIPFNLANGERVTGRIVLQRSAVGTIVPQESILTGDANSTNFLFKVISNDNTNFIKKVPVKIQLSGRNGVAVTGSIQPGDKVIVAQESVLLSLKDGDPVIINKGVLQ